MGIAIKEFPQYLGVNNELLDGGTVTYYEASENGSLTTLKDIFTDPSYSTSASNPQELTALGATEDAIYLTYPYGVVVKDAGGAVVKTVGWVDPSSDESDSVNGALLDNIAGLRSQSTPTLNGGLYTVKGYYESGDQGGGAFIWDSTSTLSDNNGTVIAPNGNPAVGRYIRQVDDYLTPQMFGAVENNATIDCSSAIVNCANEASYGLLQRTVFFPDGSYNINGSVSIVGGFKLEFDDRVRFTTNDDPTSSYEIDINVPIFIPPKQGFSIVDGLNVVLSVTVTNASLDVSPNWFADKGGLLNDSGILNRAYNNTTLIYGGSMVIADNWDLTGAIDISSIDTKFVYNGSFTGVIDNDSVVNVGSVTSEANSPIFLSDIENWTITEKTVYLSWFTDGVAFDSAVAMMRMASEDDTKKVTIVVDVDAIFTAETYTSQKNITWSFENGIITCNYECYFNNIESTVKQIFSTDSTAFPRLLDVIDVRWFGAVAEDELNTTNHTAIANALGSCWLHIKEEQTGSSRGSWANGASYVTGGGQRYYFNNSIVVWDSAGYDGDVLTRLLFENCTLIQGENFTDTSGILGGSYAGYDYGGFDGTYTFYTNIPIHFKRCKFGGDTDTSGVDNKYTSTMCSISMDDLGCYYESCKFTGVVIFPSIATGFEFKKNIVTGGDLFFGNIAEAQFNVTNVDVKENSFVGFPDFNDGIHESGALVYENKYIEIERNTFNDYATERFTELRLTEVVYIFDEGWSNVQIGSGIIGGASSTTNRFIFPYFTTHGTVVDSSRSFHNGSMCTAGTPANSKRTGDGIRSIYPSNYSLDVNGLVVANYVRWSEMEDTDSGLLGQPVASVLRVNTIYGLGTAIYG